MIILDTLNLKLIVVLIVCLMLFPFLLYSVALSIEKEPVEVNDNVDEFYVGVDVAFDDVDQTKEIIDRVDSYSNFFLLGTTGISHEAKKLDELCSILAKKEMYFVVYQEEHWRLDMLPVIEERYGDYFLGLEFEDEFGGLQLDLWEYKWVRSAENYSDASEKFVNALNRYLTEPFFSFGLVPDDFLLFTADYALYWFDYLAGYDVVLAEFGWNYSRQINVAMCRGAATIMDKDWGAIVAWTYTEPPYLGSGEELFDDLVLAYENGAKYVIIFDSNEDYTSSTLLDEHFDAMERFWQYTKDNPRPADLLDDRAAYVLPRDWAYGFRGPDDKIWGLWETDELVSGISEDLGVLLDKYGSKLDVIYDDNLALDNTYKKYIFWNGTTITP